MAISYVYIYIIGHPNWGFCTTSLGCPHSVASSRPPTWGITDDNGVARPPLVETLIRDLSAMGHSFTYSKVDAQNYLLPQRRNRVFGCSSAINNRDPEDVISDHQKWKAIFGKFGMGPKSQQFTLEDTLEKGVEPQPLHAPQDIRNWGLIEKRVKKAKQDPSRLCMHMGSSESRLEYMVGASTCVRPSHDIYCNVVGRPLIGCELLRLQGSFPDDYSCPDALADLPEGLKRDLAGNAFPTTVLQANLIATMIAHQDAWHQAASREDFASPKRGSRLNRKRPRQRQPPPEDGDGEPPCSKAKKNNRKRPSDDETLVGWRLVYLLWKTKTHVGNTVERKEC